MICTFIGGLNNVSSFRGYDLNCAPSLVAVILYLHL